MKYVLKTLLFQAVVLPVLAAPVLFATFFLSILNVPNVVSTLIFLALMAIASLLCGWVFSKKVKNKPAPVWKRTLAMCLMPVYALTMWLIFCPSGLASHTPSLPTYFWLHNPFFFIPDFFLQVYGYLYTVLLLEITIYLFFIIGFAASELADRRLIKSRGNILARAGTVAAALVLLAGTFHYVYNAEYQSQMADLTMGIVDVSDNLDLMAFIPFYTGNNLAVLKEGKASLQFDSTADMPRLDGATAAYPVYAAFAQAVYSGLKPFKPDPDGDGTDYISNTNPPYDTVRCSQTADAYNNLLSGKADIIFTAEPSKAEIQQYAAYGAKLVLTPIAKDAFVFFVNSGNRVNGLSSRQIRDIYSGKTKNWLWIGGSLSSIVAYQRPDDSGSQTIMQNVVMKNEKLMAPKTEVIAEMDGIINQIASYHDSANALGYTFMYYSTAMVKSNKIKYLAVDGVEPMPQTVRNGTYPYTVSLYAVTLSTNTNANVKRFLNWMQGSEGQELVGKTGYVSIK